MSNIFMHPRRKISLPKPYDAVICMSFQRRNREQHERVAEGWVLSFAPALDFFFNSRFSWSTTVHFTIRHTMSNQAISPIILTAFSTSAAAIATSKKIETAVRNHFPDRPVFWGYNKRTVTRAQKKGQKDIRLPLDILHDLAAKGYQIAIVQSLHLLPGFEFHELHHEVRQATGIDCRLGLPLFSSPSDYQTLLDLLAPHIMKNQQQAVLLIGHGTRHPVWTAYLAVENLLRQRFGERIFVGVIEHYPETDHLVQAIVDKGYKQVLLIPFFFSHGFHVARDILGNEEHSWKSRLEHNGLKVEAMLEGIGMLPGIGKLVASHIKDTAHSPKTE